MKHCLQGKRQLACETENDYAAELLEVALLNVQCVLDTKIGSLTLILLGS